MIVYLSQVGSWVPAASARVPLVNKIFTRIQTVESISLGLSSFLCGVNQVVSYCIFKFPKILILETSIYFVVFLLFFSPKFKKLNISLIYKAIIVIFSVSLPMVNIYKYCKKFLSNHMENLENNV